MASVVVLPLRDPFVLGKQTVRAYLLPKAIGQHVADGSLAGTDDRSAGGWALWGSTRPPADAGRPGPDPDEEGADRE